MMIYLLAILLVLLFHLNQLIQEPPRIRRGGEQVNILTQQARNAIAKTSRPWIKSAYGIGGIGYE